MSLTEFEAAAKAMHISIDTAIATVSEGAIKAQALITQAVVAAINRFELTDGRFVANQDYASRFAALEKKINSILGEKFLPAVKEYLPVYKTIEETTLSLQKGYNQIKVDLELISPARKAAYESATYYLRDALKDAYIQPAKFVLAQQVVGGAGIQDTIALLERWDKEGLPKELSNGRQTPNLRQYATQIARDSAHGYNGVIQERIAAEYGLTSFIYVGGEIADSRPFCKHLVGLKRKISLREIPKLVEQYPQGLIEGTTQKTFLAYRGGYNCRHGAMPVRD